MSFAIAFKASEGVVLAVDSRTTFTSQEPNTDLVFASTYDNAMKLLYTKKQSHIGAMTYGAGAINSLSPRTVHSYLPEFENYIRTQPRLSVLNFALLLRDFFNNAWASAAPNNPPGHIYFLVGGYNENEGHGRVYLTHVPNENIEPIEIRAADGDFGLCWGGVTTHAFHLLGGVGDQVLQQLRDLLSLTDEQCQNIQQTILNPLSVSIPYGFLPLQDCIDLSVFLIETTTKLMHFTSGVRSVGGPVDIAVITQKEGLRIVRQKRVTSSVLP